MWLSHLHCLYYLMQAYRDNLDGQYFVQCDSCQHYASFVICKECGLGGDYVPNLLAKPSQWQCPNCRTENKLSDNFYHYVTPMYLGSPFKDFAETTAATHPEDASQTTIYPSRRALYLAGLCTVFGVLLSIVAFSINPSPAWRIIEVSLIALLFGSISYSMLKHYWPYRPAVIANQEGLTIPKYENLVIPWKQIEDVRTLDLSDSHILPIRRVAIRYSDKPLDSVHILPEFADQHYSLVEIDFAFLQEKYDELISIIDTHL